MKLVAKWIKYSYTWKLMYIPVIILINLQNNFIFYNYLHSILKYFVQQPNNIPN